MVKLDFNASYPPYTGELATPIAPLPERLPLSSDKDMQKLISDLSAHQQAEYVRKFYLLLNFYGIPRDIEGAKEHLLLKMIDHHVPGMRVDKQRRRGPRQKWDTEALFSLFVAVQSLVAEGKSETAACRSLHASGAFKSKRAESLQRRYAEAREEPMVAALLHLFGTFPDGTDLGPLWRKWAEAWPSPYAESQI
jgi:hypothetical protein